MSQHPESNATDPGQPCLPLARRLRAVLATVPLQRHQDLIQDTAAELGVDILQCAAALLHLLQADANPQPNSPKPTDCPAPNLKMIRYRLDIGSQHQLSMEQLKKTLVAESGVDKNNIHNITIRGTYTLIDMPDAMPQDIYQHLKSVELNGRQLDIKRVKPRKKRPITNHRGKTLNSLHETAKPEPLIENRRAGL